MPSRMTSWIAGCMFFLVIVPCIVRGAEPAPKDRGRESTIAEEAAEKKRIMESDQWHQARLAFDEWLSVQQIYDAEQVAQLPNRFRQRIAEMSARELQVFLDQMQSKLAILLSPQAADARNWLGRYVSARVVFSENELKQFDIVNMTPAQLDAVMRTVETRRASRRRAAEAHNRSRQDQVERHLGLQRQQEQSRLQARSAASAASRNSRSSFQSQYAPRRPEPAPAPRPALFVDPFGGISRTLP